MWTKTFVCAAALMIAGSIFVYAQQGPGEPGASGENKGVVSTERNWQCSRRTGPRLPMRASRRFMQDSNSTQIRGRTGRLLSRHCVNLLNCGRIDLRAISSHPLIQLCDCSAWPMP